MLCFFNKTASEGTTMKLRLAGLIILVLLSGRANAWFFIFPIPNVAKPAALQSLINALEKSEETRAVAYVSEDKTFASKVWTWGKYSGLVSQEEADQRALDMCRSNLAVAKAKTEGGQKLYDFGTKDCELYSYFTPNDGPKKAEAKRKADEAEAARLAEIEEAKKVAAEEERKRIAVEEERKRIAAEEERVRIATAEEEQRREEAERVAAAKTKGGVKTKAVQKQTLVSPQAGSVDFNAEATKAARILGCQSPELKVTGTDAGNILYLARCADTKTLNLKCDKSGLCLARQ
jgi:hypothetical protein